MKEGNFEARKNLPHEFLDENLKLTFEIQPEASAWLPEISKEDIALKRERYRIFLGTWSMNPNGAHVKIEAIYEIPDDPEFYTEGTKEVTLQLGNIIKQIENLRQQFPEYSKLQIVGDIHTHPVFAEEMTGGLKPWNPSSGDIDDIIRGYENGNIRQDRPFIFGIAVPHHDGRTLYAYYRLSKKDERYRVESLKGNYKSTE